MTWLALDIGGANLKLADGQGFAASAPFPLWQQPQQLSQALRALLAQAPPATHLAATMTGELADCFATKAAGVQFIVAALEAAADGRHTRVYQTSGQLVAPAAALKKPLLAAASNWHALARFAGRFVPRGTGLVVDVGSTTTDLVPLLDGVPVPAARTDFDRLATGELIYQGVRRTPVIALLHEVKLNRGYVPLAAELFATTLDVFLVLGMLPENEADCDTADGRPATIACARQRLARMLCADQEQLTKGELQSFAQQVYNRLLDRILDSEAWTRHPLSGRFQTLILSGSGECVIKSAWKGQSPGFQMVWLSDILGPEASAAACAVAVAELAVEAAAR